MPEDEGSAGRGDEMSLAFVCSAATDDEHEAGVFTYSFDPADGSLTRLSHTPLRRPMYLAVHPGGERLSVVNRPAGDADGQVLTFAIDHASGTLSLLSRRSSGGLGPCYVSVDAASRFVFTANYAAGTVAMLPVESEGSVGPPSHVVKHDGSGELAGPQVEPHPHAAVPGPRNRFLYVPDLGLDRVVAYHIDAKAGRLDAAPARSVDLPPGAGPRHMEFGPDGESAFLVNELNSTLTRLAVGADSGALSVEATVSTLPPDESASDCPAADVHVHPSGRWVFASNRGHDSIATFAVADGELKLVGHEPTRGRKPRDFSLGPTGRWLLVENRDSHRIRSFSVYAETGSLSARDDETAVGKPTCAVVLPRE
ncbi:lactonase family protein [Haloarchaeobius sp. DFWS5]|uniref:lactonase family protein n=1 Tax=Haloarchaeobius sp. DFWS5 TaxID=3446114 RepID=UPI003EB88FA9